jgi:DNA-binding NarL/FixJ family response regulator
MKAKQLLPRDPFPPSPGKRTRNQGGKPAEPRGGNVIQFRAKKPTPDDVKALIASGKSHKEIEELLGISRSTIKRHKKAAS